MPTTIPTKLELIEAVTEFLRDKMVPELSKDMAFNARVAANVLDIVGRELQMEHSAEREETERLAHLLGQEGTKEDLTQCLCEAIRDGRLDYTHQDLMSHLAKSATIKMAIDNPKYPSFIYDGDIP